MNKQHSIAQFFKDGLIGVIIAALVSLLQWLAIPVLFTFYPPVRAGDTVSLIASMLGFWFVPAGWFWSNEIPLSFGTWFMNGEMVGLLSSPGLFFMIAMFVSTGLNIRFIKTQSIPTRKDWIKPILKMLRTAWLVTLPTALLYFVFTPIVYSLFKLAEHHDFHHSFSQALWAVYDAVTKGFSLIATSFTPIFPYGAYIIGSIIGLLIGFVITCLAAMRFNPQKQSTRIFISIIANLSIIFSMSLCAGGIFFILLMMAY